MSLPAWERGLKYPGEHGVVNVGHVAPGLGAWIEMRSRRDLMRSFTCRSRLGSVD